MEKCDTGGSPLVDNMELLQDDESPLSFDPDSLESSPSPQNIIGPLIKKSISIQEKKTHVDVFYIYIYIW